MRTIAGALIVMAGAFLCGVGATLNSGASHAEGTIFGGGVLILVGLGATAGDLATRRPPPEGGGS